MGLTGDVALRTQGICNRALQFQQAPQQRVPAEAAMSEHVHHCCRPACVVCVYLHIRAATLIRVPTCCTGRQSQTRRLCQSQGA